MRLIDAGVLQEEYKKRHDGKRLLLIDVAPTVDAVPVVRCRDCKWYQPDADKWCGYFECMGFEPDDYCNQGERKDGDRAKGTIQKE